MSATPNNVESNGDPHAEHTAWMQAQLAERVPMPPVDSMNLGTVADVIAAVGMPEPDPRSTDDDALLKARDLLRAALALVDAEDYRGPTAIIARLSAAVSLLPGAL